MKPILFILSALFIMNSVFAQNLDSVFVSIYPDSLCIRNSDISATCGTNFFNSVIISNDSIFVIESDTSHIHQDCICNYDVDITIGGINAGNYCLFILRTGIFAKDTSLVGSTYITIPQSISPPFSIKSYNSTCHAVSGITYESNGIPRNSSLLGNFPNPFNAQTIIRYQVHQQCRVKLEIYDALGRITAKLVDELKDVGDYEIPWNAVNFSSGFYFCRLAAGNKILSHKMIVLK